MERLFVEKLGRADKEVRLSVEETHHALHVLRKKTGELVEITDGKGHLATARLLESHRKQALCQIQEVNLLPPPPSRNIEVAVALIRPNRMDWALEKLTELGVGSISPLLTDFCSVRHFKYDHSRKIMISAIKQSRQVYLPELHQPRTFSEWLHAVNNSPVLQKLIAHAGSQFSLRNLSLSEKDICVIAVGPEGGFSEIELTRAQENGFQFVQLSDSILRTETAAVSAAAQLKLFYLGEL